MMDNKQIFFDSTGLDSVGFVVNGCAYEVVVRLWSECG